MLLPAELWPEHVPVSKVHASDAEWYSIVKGRVDRLMFEAVEDHEVARAPDDTKILNGAMGVDKWKDVGGVATRYLRFISS